MKIRLMIIALVSVLLSACATSANYLQTINSWRGANINHLTGIWGYPDKNSRAPNGHKLYIYSYHRHGRTPIYSTPGSTTVQTENGRTYVQSTGPSFSGGQVYDDRCTTWFEVNHRHIIVKTAARGNSCKATDDFKKRMSNFP